MQAGFSGLILHVLAGTQSCQSFFLNQVLALSIYTAEAQVEDFFACSFPKTEMNQRVAPRPFERNTALSCLVDLICLVPVQGIRAQITIEGSNSTVWLESQSFDGQTIVSLRKLQAADSLYGTPPSFLLCACAPQNACSVPTGHDLLKHADYPSGLPLCVWHAQS